MEGQQEAILKGRRVGVATLQPPHTARVKCPPRTCPTLLPHPGSTSALLDLSGLDLPPTGTTYPAMPTHPADQTSPEQLSTSVSLLDDELMSLGEEEGQALVVGECWGVKPRSHLAARQAPAFALQRWIQWRAWGAGKAKFRAEEAMAPGVRSEVTQPPGKAGRL